LIVIVYLFSVFFLHNALRTSTAKGTKPRQYKIIRRSVRWTRTHLLYYAAL